MDFAEGGLVRGSELASTFASLRANELVWFYVVNNYLKGKTPEAFDLLYWNSDGSNLPGKLYAWYVRNMYFENNLRVPDKLTALGTPLNLRNITVPTFVLAAREDHIVPWHSAYISARLLGSDDIEFVLAASGHIAGVINPASKNRRNYWVGEGKLQESHEEWLASAKSGAGQLVAALVGMARQAIGGRGARAEEDRQPHLLRARAGARQLCEGAARVTGPHTGQGPLRITRRGPSFVVAGFRLETRSRLWRALASPLPQPYRYLGAGFLTAALAASEVACVAARIDVSAICVT